MRLSLRVTLRWCVNGGRVAWRRRFFLGLRARGSVWRRGPTLTGHALLLRARPVRLSVPDRGPQASHRFRSRSGREEAWWPSLGRAPRRSSMRRTSSSCNGYARSTWPRTRARCACGCPPRPGRGAGSAGCGTCQPAPKAVIDLADHLVCQGVEKVTVESTSDYWADLVLPIGGSRPGRAVGQRGPATSRTSLPGRRPTNWTRCGWPSLTEKGAAAALVRASAQDQGQAELGLINTDLGSDYFNQPHRPSTPNPQPHPSTPGARPPGHPQRRRLTQPTPPRPAPTTPRRRRTHHAKVLWFRHTSHAVTG